MMCAAQDTRLLFPSEGHGWLGHESFLLLTDEIKRNLTRRGEGRRSALNPDFHYCAFNDVVYRGSTHCTEEVWFRRSFGSVVSHPWDSRMHVTIPRAV